MSDTCPHCGAPPSHNGLHNWVCGMSRTNGGEVVAYGMQDGLGCDYAASLRAERDKWKEAYETIGRDNQELEKENWEMAEAILNHETWVKDMGCAAGHPAQSDLFALAEKLQTIKDAKNSYEKREDSHKGDT